MSRRTEPQRDDLAAASAAACAVTDADAAATSSVIATLRRRLRHQNILEHPDVSRELRKLEEQLSTQLNETGRGGGRHRATPGAASGQAGAGPGGDRQARMALVPVPQAG